MVGGLTAMALLAGGLAAEGAPAGAVASEPASYVAPSQASAYKLVWRDEFNGTSLSQRWQTRPAVQSSRPCTTVKRSMSTVSKGKAHISAKVDPSKPRSKACPNGWLLNSQITTEASKQFKFGKFTARIKFHKQSGAHGGFFLYYPPGVASNVPASDDAGSRGAEIDVVEYFGEANVNDGLKGAIQNSVYWNYDRPDGSLALAKAGSRKSVKKYLKKGRSPGDDFHTYTMEWTPTQYIFRFDGHVTSRITKGISRRAEFLFLSMLTSPFEAKYLNRKKLPARMDIDWVRVYQK